MNQLGNVDWPWSSIRGLLVATVGVVAVFVFDLMTPLGIAAWIGYVLPLWYVSRLSVKPVVLPSITLVCTGLIAVGLFMSPPGISMLTAAINRTMEVLFLWVMTVAFLRAQAAGEQLRGAHDQIRYNDARYRDLVHALPAAVYTCDREGHITLYNQVAAALWGSEPEVGKDLWYGSWKLYRPDDSPLPLDECPMAVTLREGRAVRGEEIVIQRPDGMKRHMLPHCEPIRNIKGATVGSLNMLIDITEHKQAERAIADLAAIVISSDDAIIGKDLHGIVTSWNQGAERLFGYSAEEMIGQPVSRLIPPDRHDEEPDILTRLARGESIDHYQTVRRRKDGSEVYVSLTVSPVRDSQGRILGAAKIARDITMQKRAEEALRERDRALLLANDALSRQKAALVEANKELESFSYPSRMTCGPHYGRSMRSVVLWKRITGNMILCRPVFGQAVLHCL